jgi:hypothetical protein
LIAVRERVEDRHELIIAPRGKLPSVLGELEPVPPGSLAL